MEIGASTRLLAILGDPVAHSLSPLMHNAAIRALGLDAVYVALRVPADRLPDALRALAAAGGAGSITVPHKEAAEKRCIARKTGLCARTGACNTFWVENGDLVGDNTDVAGITAALAALGASGAGRWLVLGTGGTARAAAVAAADAGGAVLVRSRTAARAAAFTAWGAAAGVPCQPWRDGERADVVINTTPLGLRAGDPLPIEPPAVAAPQVALDMVYARGETAWARAMRRAGCRAVDGRAALVAQGAAAFERFFPGVAAPREVMRAAVERALDG